MTGVGDAPSLALRLGNRTPLGMCPPRGPAHGKRVREFCGAEQGCSCRPGDTLTMERVVYTAAYGRRRTRRRLWSEGRQR